jgi:O-antigen ligase
MMFSHFFHKIHKTQVLRSFDLSVSVLSGIAVLLLLIGEFCWPGTDGSLFSIIRTTLLFGSIFSILSLRKPVLDGNLFVFMLLWFYLFLNACFIGEEQATRRLAIILVFAYVATPFLRDYYFCRKIIICVVGVVTFCALFSLVYHAVLGELNFSYRATPISGTGFKNFGEFYNTVDAGTNYAPSLAFATWLSLTANRRITVIVWASCAFILAAFIYFTYSRTAWLFGMISVSILLLFMATPQAKKVVLRIVCGIAVLVLVFGQEPILYEFTDRGLTFRDEIWTYLVSKMPGYWITGHGAGMNLDSFPDGDGRTVGHAHNLYLQILYQFGLTGVILMLFSSISCIVKLFRLRTNALASLWLSVLSGGLVAMLFAMNNFVGVPNRIWIYFWLPVAGCLALVSRECRADIQNIKPSVDSVL